MSRLSFVAALALGPAIVVTPSHSGFAQQAPPAGAQAAGREAVLDAALGAIPDDLDVLLERALRANPDVLLAEAKLRQAQTVLNQQRMQVIQRVVSVYYQRKTHRQVSEQLRRRLAAAEQQHRAGTTTDASVAEAVVEVSQAEASLALAESELRYAIGLGSVASLPEERPMPRTVAPEADAPEPRRPALSDELARQLATRLPAAFADTTLSDIVEWLRASTPDVVYVIDPCVDAGELIASITFGSAVPIATVWSALYDSFGGAICLVARDYGFLVTTPERAERIWAATLPPNLPLHASAVPSGN